MKILFLAHRAPYPPDKGDKIRSFNLLSQMSKRHQISLAYWIDDNRDVEHATVLSSICRGKIVAAPLGRLSASCRALWSLARGKSFTEGYYYSSRFQARVDDLIRDDQPDLVFVFSSAMAPYVSGYRTLPRIVDFVDVDSDKWRQLSEFAGFPRSLLYRLESKRLAQLEIESGAYASHSLFISDVEAGLFRELGGKGTIVVLPNGVDGATARFPCWSESKADRERNNGGLRRSVRLLFIGTMNYVPNADAVLYFARQILPIIRARFPQTVFDIVGRKPPRSVLRLDGSDGVRVHGEVQGVESFLAQADVSVAPLRIARGVQNKVLEAMAAGVPVVATPEAVRGIRVVDGQEVLLANTPDLFAAQVMRLLSDAQLRKQLVAKARQKLQQVYNWRLIGEQLQDLLDSVRLEDSAARDGDDSDAEESAGKRAGLSVPIAARTRNCR